MMNKVKYRLDSGKIILAGPMPDIQPDDLHGIIETEMEGITTVTHKVDLDSKTVIARPAPDIEKDAQDEKAARRERKRLVASALNIPPGKKAEFLRGLRELLSDGNDD